MPHEVAVASIVRIALIRIRVIEGKGIETEAAAEMVETVVETADVLPTEVPATEMTAATSHMHSAAMHASSPR